MSKKKTLLSVAIVALLMPMKTFAQDDMYFTPSKKQIQAEKEAKQKARETYYSGINMSDDDYNRRNWRKYRQQVTVADSLSDVIEFQAGPGDYSDTLSVSDYGRSFAYDDADDYRYSRHLSRFDNYYYGWYDPWMMRQHYWASPYYAWGGRYGWYDPFYDPFYDPWFDPWYSPYYNPIYDPFYYGWNGYPYGYRHWGWGWHYPQYFVKYDGPTGTRNHSGGIVHRSGTSNHSASRSYTIAQRNDRRSNMTNRESRYANRNTSYNNHSNEVWHDTGANRSNSSFRNSGSGSISGGGHGGGSFGGGGGRSGSGGGGSFGRRH